MFAIMRNGTEGSCQGRRGGEPRHRQHPGEGAQLPGGQAGKGHHQAGRGTAAGIVCGIGDLVKVPTRENSQN